jgi:hypothetical protein
MDSLEVFFFLICFLPNLGWLRLLLYLTLFPSFALCTTLS